MYVLYLLTFYDLLYYFSDEIFFWEGGVGDTKANGLVVLPGVATARKKNISTEVVALIKLLIDDRCIR